jgi:8-oxo-dGTP pyrophosphatase MutT (NUDIX family)
METSARRIRNSARALLVTPEREILLVRWSARALGRSFWITPGGGVEPGESEREAAAREVAEETGLVAAPIGPAVWTRRVEIPWAEPPFTQRETYFWVPTPRFDPSRAGIPTEAERSEIEAYRWWRVAELEGSAEHFAPRRIGALLRGLLERGLPGAPVDVGV